MISARIEKWAIAGTFTISRGSKREAVVIVAEVTDGQVTGRGECVPYAHYGETPEGVLAQIQAAHVENRAQLRSALPPGAARNALDCALWDFEAKAKDIHAFVMAGLEDIHPVLTAYTLSLAPAEDMAARAKDANFPLLKLKLGAEGDEERLHAVRAARPDARMVVDANEGWRPDTVEDLLNLCASLKVELVEQPLPADDDAALAEIERSVVVCADESVHATNDLAGLIDRYDAVNIKLDKAGGLTEALGMVKTAHALGLKVIVGCMVSTSLAMAPAHILAQKADWVDLDGPLLLARDRSPGLKCLGTLLFPPLSALWG
jgi:L-alanine-DL-glutamate epimerase-like enolase superfamily enzyme